MLNSDRVYEGTSRQSIMRKAVAIALMPLFLVLLFAAITLNHVAATISGPEILAGLVSDSEAYDYIYDELIANLVYDVVDEGFEIESSSSPELISRTLQFDDPIAATAAITKLIDVLVPREYVQEKFEESIEEVLAYARGDTNQLTIDLEVQERILAVPNAASDAMSDLNLAEEIVNDLLIPQLGVLSSDVFDQALGISFSQQEIVDYAHRILAPEWLEYQALRAIDTAVPYFAGDADRFNFVLEYDDRVVVAGQILKNKLGAEETLYRLVFAQVIGPLISQSVADSTSVGYGISLTDQEVGDAFEAIAPRAWVREQGDGIIDALVEYLTGRSESFGYVVDLADRKAVAAVELQGLARRKMEATLGGIPSCYSSAEAIDAAQDLAEQRIPRCIAGGQETLAVTLDTFGQLMDSVIDSTLMQQVPDRLFYSQAMFESQTGSGISSLKSVRRNIIQGVDFSEQDVIDGMALGFNPRSRTRAVDTLQTVADGVLITEKFITSNLDSKQRDQLDAVRGNLNLALSFRWLLWAVALIPLIAIAFIAGRNWASRLKWAGGIAAVSALIIYSAIGIAWSFALSDLVEERLPAFDSIGERVENDFPRFGAELQSNEPEGRIMKSLESWKDGWRDQAIPWVIAGVVGFVVGTGWPSAGSRPTRMSGRKARAAASVSQSRPDIADEETGPNGLNSPDSKLTAAEDFEAAESGVEEARYDLNSSADVGPPAEMEPDPK